MRLLYLLVLSCAYATAYGQSMSYSDADTPAEAVGMMNTSMVSADKMLAECSARFPELAGTMASDLRVWQETEKSVLRKATFHWAEAAKLDPNLHKFRPYVESTVVRNIEGLANAPFPGAEGHLRDYCKKHFADLASGIWRTRTPRAYKFLDQAPEVPQ